MKRIYMYFITSSIRTYWAFVSWWENLRPNFSSGKLLLFGKRAKRQTIKMTEVCRCIIRDNDSINQVKSWLLGIRKATSWFKTHVLETHPPHRSSSKKSSSDGVPQVILVTDDSANRRLAEAAGLSAVSSMSLLVTSLFTSQILTYFF